MEAANVAPGEAKVTAAMEDLVVQEIKQAETLWGRHPDVVRPRGLNSQVSPGWHPRAIWWNLPVFTAGPVLEILTGQVLVGLAASCGQPL